MLFNIFKKRKAEKEQEIITLRGHHLYRFWEYLGYKNKTCKENWKGGYGEEHGKAEIKIFDKILSNPNSLVTIVSSKDNTICSACPKNEPRDKSSIYTKCYEDREFELYDKLGAEHVGLSVGKKYTIRELCEILTKRDARPADIPFLSPNLNREAYKQLSA